MGNACNSEKSVETVESSNKSTQSEPSSHDIKARESIKKSQLKLNDDDNKSKSSKSYKLSYFDLRGRAEIIRLIFAVSGVKYDDNRISFDSWPELKKNLPLGALPVLDFDDTHLVQSIAIARYLAKENGLAGETSMQQTQADVVVDAALDLFNAFGEKIFPLMMKNDPSLAEKSSEFIDHDVKKHLKNLEKLMDLFESKEYFVGSKLTWCDLFVFEVITNCLQLSLNVLGDFPKLKKHRATIENHERISNYLKQRKI